MPLVFGKRKKDKYVNKNLYFESKHSSNTFIEKEK